MSHNIPNMVLYASGSLEGLASICHAESKLDPEPETTKQRTNPNPAQTPKEPSDPPPLLQLEPPKRGEAFSLTVGAFLLTVKLLCLQSLKALIRRTLLPL